MDHQTGKDASKLADVSAKRNYLPNEAAAGQSVLISGHNKDGFDPPDGSVGQGELEFIPEVGDIPDAAEDGGSAGLLHKIDGEPGVFLDVDCGYVFQQRADHRDALGKGEEFRLLGIVSDGDDEPVEKSDASANDVEMAFGDGIKLAGEYGYFGHAGWHQLEMIGNGRRITNKPSDPLEAFYFTPRNA